MNHFLILILTFAFAAPSAFAAQYCNETYSYSTNDMGMEIRKMERRCREKAAVKAKDEYEFRFPKGNDFNVRVRVNKERSEFDGCKLGSSKVVVRGDGKWSGKIYVNSEKKDTMPSYRMEFKYIIPHHACGQNVPEGYVLRDRDGSCYYQKLDCTERCESDEMGQWMDDSCICTPKDAGTGKRG
jgi:hypothetical protein